MKSVVVTGAASGIGAAIARHLADAGWRVIGVDRNVPEAADHLLRFEQADLTDVETTARLARKLADEGIQALVHAAGLMRTAPLGAADPADADVMWQIHVRALGILAGALSARMAEGGRIVAIGSRTSRGAANKAYYAATKSAVVGLIRSLAKEVVGRGITANVVAPAATATPMLSRADRADVAPELPPLGRYVDPAEIAALVEYLLLPQAAAITGQEIIICGGASL